MSIPVTDAFRDNDSFTSLTVRLRPAQLEWLRQRADSNDCSIDRMARSIINDYMNQEGADSASAPGTASGEGAAETQGSGSEGASASQDEEAPKERQSVVESLRSTSERLERLTKKSEEKKVPNPLERLKKRVGAQNEDDTPTDAQKKRPPRRVSASNAQKASDVSASDVMPSDFSVPDPQFDEPGEPSGEPSSNDDTGASTGAVEKMLNGTSAGHSDTGSTGSQSATNQEDDGDEADRPDTSADEKSGQSMFDMMDD
jgi:hypothetical protein